MMKFEYWILCNICYSFFSAAQNQGNKFLIGPEKSFDQQEIDFLSFEQLHKKIIANITYVIFNIQI